MVHVVLGQAAAIKSLTNNECWLCSEHTTAEGFFCRAHWDVCPGQFKTELVNMKLAAVNVVQCLADLKESEQ